MNFFKRVNDFFFYMYSNYFKKIYFTKYNWIVNFFKVVDIFKKFKRNQMKELLIILHNKLKTVKFLYYLKLR